MIKKCIKDYDFNSEKTFIKDINNNDSISKLGFDFKNKSYNLIFVSFITWRLYQYMQKY